MTGYGLALAGGGTKGAYQIGVWEALMKLEIPVTCITGTSVGSINAALFAQGDFEAAKRLWSELTAEQVIRVSGELPEKNNLLALKNFPHLLKEIYENDGLVSDPLRELLESLVDEPKLRASEIGFGLTATSLSDLKNNEMFLEDIPNGKLVDCIMASACFPGLKRQYLENKPYADGGITNNLPVDMLFSRGYRDVIAVDIGGVGRVQGTFGFDRNVRHIRCSEDLVGLFDFHQDQLHICMRLGYLDTLKSFGRLCGEKYFFNTADYAKNRARYAPELLSGLELAAEAYGISRYKIYRVEDLIAGVLRGYREECKRISPDAKPDWLAKFKTGDPKAITLVCRMLVEKGTERPAPIANAIGDCLPAAGAVAYFCKRGGGDG